MRTYRRNRASMLAGFTLVEILIVIVIIGLLAGMTTTVVVSARRSVNNSIVSSQMAQLSIALDEYKNRFGEYPPDLSDSDAVIRHIKKRWPRYHVGYDQFLEHIGKGCGISSGLYDSDGRLAEYGQHIWDPRAYISSLVFWLGGLPDKNGIPSGFYLSPKSPLGIDANDDEITRPGRAKKEKPFFSFERKHLGAYLCQEDSAQGANYYFKTEDDSLLWDDDLGAYVYTPAFCQGDYPVVYFRPSSSMPYGSKFFYLKHSPDVADNCSCAVPYMQDGSTWYEEKRFQLIHPGEDGLFGSVNSDPRVVPTKQNTSLEDADNLTNFVESGTLERLYD